LVDQAHPETVKHSNYYFKNFYFNLKRDYTAAACLIERHSLPKGTRQQEFLLLNTFLSVKQVKKSVKSGIQSSYQATKKQGCDYSNYVWFL
jgi:hypothetical protein